MSAKDLEYIQQATAVVDPTMEAILKSRVVDFDDTTYPAFDPLVGEAIQDFIRAYRGPNGFLNKVKRFPAPSIRQKRAVANIIRRALRGEEQDSRHGFAPQVGATTLPAPSPTTTPASVPPPAPLLQRGLVIDDRQAAHAAIIGTNLKAWECFQCHKYIIGHYEDLQAHKQMTCPNRSLRSAGATSKNQRVSAAFVRKEPTHNLDLRGVFPPNARFAVRQPDGSCNFYIKTTLKRRTKLTGRFAWSKYPTYWNYLTPGCVTLRKQSGDTKEFIGMQDTDDSVYFGEYEEDIAQAFSNPTEAMVLYGKEIGVCCYCGRSLTDYESKQLGIGPDCLMDKHIPYLASLKVRP